MQMTNRTRFGPFCAFGWGGGFREGGGGEVPRGGGCGGQKKDCGLQINEINLIFPIQRRRRGPAELGGRPNCSG